MVKVEGVAELVNEFLSSDFASKLIGKIENIALPQRGCWVLQGQKIWTILRDGKSVDMVSPIEGTVTDINESGHEGS